MEVLGLVLLAGRTGADKVAHHTPVVLDEELCAQALEGFLNPLVAGGVGELQDVLEYCGVVRDEHPAIMEKQAIAHSLGHAMGTRGDRVPSRAQCRVGLQLTANVVEEPKAGDRDRREGRWSGVDEWRQNR